jgi:chemotaxis protein MotB
MKTEIVAQCLCGVLLVISMTGCSAMKKLEEENQTLKQEVVQLQQVNEDYSDKLQQTEQLSAKEKGQLRSDMAVMRDQLNQKLQQQIEQNQVLVQKLKDLTVVEIAEVGLFNSGSVDLTPEGLAIIKDLAQTFEQYPDYHMRIEGHSDAKPLADELKKQYASNWELSAARAATVAKYMIYGLTLPAERLSIAGFAHYRPIADNESKEGRAKNRRIRVVIFKVIH